MTTVLICVWALTFGWALAATLAHMRLRRAAGAGNGPGQSYTPAEPELKVSEMRSGSIPDEWWDWHGHEVTRDGLPPGRAASIADDILSSE